MMDWLFNAFGWVCGQNSSHTWVLAGQSLPFCERCTGLYAGVGLAWIALSVLRPRLTASFLWCHAGLLVLMGPFGFHIIQQTAWLRTASGVWFGFGLVALLNLWRSPAAFGSTRGYWVALLLAVVGVPLAAASNSTVGLWALTGLGAFGGFALFGSAALSLAMICRNILPRLRALELRMADSNMDQASRGKKHPG